MSHVEWSAAAVRELEALQEPIHSRILKATDKLVNWPNVSGVKPMTGDLSGHWRLRVADKYRILFRIEQTSVIIVSVGHRDGFYD